MVPSVRVSAGPLPVPSNQSGSDGKAMVSKPAVATPPTVSPWAKLDSDLSNTPALILGCDDWTAVQSSRSPKKKRGNVDVPSKVNTFCTYCPCLLTTVLYV